MQATIFVPASLVELDGNGRALDPHDLRSSRRLTRQTGCVWYAKAASELFGFIGLRIIHPKQGLYWASFPKASHEPSYSDSVQFGAAS